ncbi:uncharacterized protein METZ01_LOCUS258660 [marine metagenome]|uniref:Uncharacterized protein n=1 Tax=marine metagenome TaxID=408172 RepID=A0A382J1M6_9ZZZZ
MVPEGKEELKLVGGWGICQSLRKGSI